MKSKFYYIALTFLGFMLNTHLAHAQDVQLPLCPNVQVINQQQALKVSILKDINGVVQATLYQGADRTKFLEVLYKKDGVIQRSRLVVTDQEIQKICDELSEQKAHSASDLEDFGKAGRNSMLKTSMVFSYGYYGWAIPRAFDAKDGKTYTASYLLATGGGFFIPFFLTRGKDITMGMASGYRAGSFLGLAHGWNATGLIMGKDIDEITRQALGITVATSIAGGITGYQLAKRYNLSNSRIHAISSGATWGMAYGYLTPMIFEADNPRIYFASSMAISGLGMWGANSLCKSQSTTTGDVMLINTSGVLGTLLCLSSMSNMDIDNEKAWIAGGILSSMAGITYGVIRTRNYDYTRQQGNIAALGALAGWLVGLGVSILTIDSGPESFLVGSISATAGFVLTDWLVRSESIGGDNRQRASLNVDFNPYPLGRLLTAKGSQQASATDVHNKFYWESNYIARLKLTF